MRLRSAYTTHNNTKQKFHERGFSTRNIDNKAVA